MISVAPSSKDADTSTVSFTTLLVEDDARLAELIVRYFSSHGVVVHHASTTHEALVMLTQVHPDVLLVDWMLPDQSGLELCRRVRERSDVPVVVLTAKSGENDRVAGFEAGADDYVVKPFSSPELLARLRAHVRRARGLVGPKRDRVIVGSLELEGRTRTAILRNKPLALTTYEFDLLFAMASRPGKPLSREQLLELVRGTADESFDRSIDVHISNLRAKLGDNPRSPALLKTVRGIGYVLAPSDDA